MMPAFEDRPRPPRTAVNAVTYTCFGCFTETVAYPPTAGQTVYCTTCRGVLETGAVTVQPSGPVCTFGVTDEDRQEMLVNRVVEAYIQEADHNAMVAAAFRMLPRPG